VRVFALDLRSIALARMAMGLLILLDLAIRFPDISAFYVADGITPVGAMPHSPLAFRYLELYRWVDNSWGVAALMGLAAVFALSLMVGFYSRTSALLSWYMLASIQNRNIYLNDGGDLTLKIFLFCSLFLPLGARWSIDAWRNPHWKQLPHRYLSLATAAVVLQFCVMYFTAGILKSDPVWRQSGDALYLALSMDQFSTEFARHLLVYPGLLRALSFAALALELTVPLLLLCPLVNDLTRTVALVLLTCFHLSVAACMHLGLFMPICLGVLLFLIPTPLMDRLEKYLRPLLPLSKGEPEAAPGGNLPPGYQPGWLGRVFPASIMVFILVQNFFTIGEVEMRPPGRSLVWILNYGRATGMMQNWTLFAPKPQTVDGWFVVDGITADGRVLDLLNGAPSSYAKPASVSAQFPSQRWRRLFQNLWIRYNPRHVPMYLRWLGRKWNREHPQERVTSLRLIFVQEVSQLPGIPVTSQAYTLGEFPSPFLEGESL